ncbi:MAG TPA: hypothetical protein VE093_13370 [Polyangiaceae bacterium]|nr:hypothetical protein [Polyangiaceae bacterium]
MNDSEKVAALEALLARVQRNAAQPRAAESPARAELAPQPLNVARAAEPLPESLDDWNISSVAPPVRPVAKPPPAPTAPYPVFREPVAAAPPPPPAASSPEAAPPPTARSAYHQDAPPPSWPDLAPPSYPTMPGIAGPPQPRPGLSPIRPVVAPAPKGLTDAQAAARAPAGAQPRPPAAGGGAPKPPPAAPPAAAGSPKPPAATPTPPTAPAEQTTGGAPAQAGPDRRAIVRTLPGVGAEQAAGPGERPEAVAAAAPPAKPAAATPATTAPKAPPALPTTPAPRTPAAAPPKAPATPAAKPPAPPNPTPPPLPALKVPTSPTPALPGAAGRPPAVPVGGAPARTTTPPGGTGAPSPGGAAANPPAAPPVAAPPVAAPPIAAPPIAAPPPARPPALQAVAKLSDVEAPPKVDIAEVEVSPDILALDRANSLPSIVDENTSDTFPGLDEAPTAKPRVVELNKLPPVNMPDEHDEEDDDEENAEEPTLLRPSPLEEQEPMEESLSEEPTLLRPSPLEKDAPLSSSEEPTLLRRSPLEQQQEDEAQAARAEGTKPSEEATDRKLRLNLPPEVIAQAEAELAASARTSPKAGGPRAVPVREAEPEEVPLNLGRRSKPRSAAFWGLALAAIASVAALIVVAIATDWPSRLRGPAQPTTASTITAAPTTPEPPITAMPTATAIAATDAGSPPEDAGTDDAAVTPALTTDSGADAGTDAGAPADAGTAATPAATPPTTAPAGSPPGDPMSLPEKKGYLVVTTPTPVHVYVQGAQAGLANESLVVDCGPKFIRLGTPPAATPPPGGGAGAVKWRSEGRSVVITCRGVTSVAMTPTP